MKQRRVLRRSLSVRQRFSLGDVLMPSHNQNQPRTIILSVKLTDATGAVEAALPIVEELMHQIESIQQLQRISEFKLMAEIHLRLNFRACDEATALVAQAIDNSAYQLEELQSTGQVADFELSYQLRE